METLLAAASSAFEDVAVYGPQRRSTESLDHEGAQLLLVMGDAGALPDTLDGMERVAHRPSTVGPLSSGELSGPETAP